MRAYADTPEAAKASRPTIVLVHGAFIDGSCWDRVDPILLSKGYTVVAVHLPLSSLADDVAAVKRVIDAQKTNVILVGHSYGGVVITEAGNHPKVTALVYVAAFGPDVGESITDLGAGAPPSEWQRALQVVDGYGSIPSDVFGRNFAQDLSPADQRIAGVKQAWTAVRLFDDRVSRPAWRSKPSWYLETLNDLAIPPAAQEQMANRMHAKLSTVESSHVAMLSRPRRVAGVILAAATNGKDCDGQTDP